MDSKYTAIGVPNGIKKISNLKRKKNGINIINAKQLKLKEDQVPTALQAEINGVNNVENNVIESSQSLLETRKQLPVYMVRGRYVYPFNWYC